MRVYLCGPMTGLPEYNYPAFHEAERQLTTVGYEVNSPARVLDPYPGLRGIRRATQFLIETMGLYPPEEELPKWRFFMRRTTIQLCASEAVAILLPREHELMLKSRGVSRELHLAEDFGIPIYTVEHLIQNAVYSRRFSPGEKQGHPLTEEMTLKEAVEYTRFHNEHVETRTSQPSDPTKSGPNAKLDNAP